MAKKSKPAQTPQEPTSRRRRSSLVDQDDSPAVGQAPRLSLPLNALDDDSFHEQPPRLSHTHDYDDDDENEVRRRAALGRDRQSMGSFADPSFADLNDLGPGEYEDVTEQRRQLLEQDPSIFLDADDDDGETAELRAMLEARRQSAQTGDLSEITDGEPTFLFRIPERSRLSLAPTVPRTPQDQVEEGNDFGDIEPDAVITAEVDYESDDEDAGTGGFDVDVDDVPLRKSSLPLQDDVDAQTKTTTKKVHKRPPKERKVSQFGIEYPPFPPAVIKRLASTFSKSYGGSGKLNKDTLGALQQATDWFFEQISEDLAIYADHAGRKTIEEADVVTLMKRYADQLILCSYLYIMLTHVCTGNVCSIRIPRFSRWRRNISRESFYSMCVCRHRRLRERSGNVQQRRGWRLLRRIGKRSERYHSLFRVTFCVRDDGFFRKIIHSIMDVAKLNEYLNSSVSFYVAIASRENVSLPREDILCMIIPQANLWCSSHGYSFILPSHSFHQL